MNAQLVIWIVLGGVTLGLAGIFVTILARSMDAGRSTSAGFDMAKIQAALPENLIGNFVKEQILAKPGDVEKEAKAAAKKSGGAVAAVIGAIVAISVGSGIASDIFDNDDGVDPEIKEIHASALAGTMINARNSDPIVLIVPGSGPIDRDGNGPSGLSTDAYRLLAEGLSKARISSVRIDKRGMFGSAAAGDPNAVSIAAYADDIHSWIDAIRAERGPESGCVFLLGHSEGALMVSAAAEGRKDVCGLILLAGTGRRLGDVLRDQLNANPANAPVLDEAFAALSELEAGRHPDTANMHPALLPLFAPPIQDFLISEMAADPVEVLARADKPALIVQGSADLQITLEDARLLNKAPHTELEIIHGMNHVLKEASADRAANLATYSDPSLPLHPKLVRQIKDFVKDND